ncbi:hypothetical protein PQQ96_29285 [Paraburkholderia sediminicola]|uniref:hypothetical protein n=1 Tax=Paraburkholderia sediminicola TaxID=458836 RepID=UPI0038BCD3B2
MINNELELVALIGNAGTAQIAHDLFALFEPKLKSWYFIRASDKGPSPGLSVNRTFGHGAAVKTLFASEKVIVLDSQTLADMSRGQATFPIDYSISLDTQALSYLEPYLLGNTAKLPKDFSEVFAFISQPNVNVDPMPYMLENMQNVTDEKKASRIYKKLYAYEVFRTIDIPNFDATGEIRSTEPSNVITTRAEVLMKDMRRDAVNKKAVNVIRYRFRLIHIILLKIACIQLSSGASVIEKLHELLTFMDQRICTIFAREALLARAYFERGQKLTFFGKIHKKGEGSAGIGAAEDLLNTLRGMAWDLLHIRHLEEAFTMRPEKSARYYFPSFLTFDKRLSEIIDLCPLRCIAYKRGSARPMPFFTKDWVREMSGDPAADAEIVRRFYSTSAVASRDRRRSRADGLFATLEAELESELLLVAGIGAGTRSS